MVSGVLGIWMCLLWVGKKNEGVGDEEGGRGGGEREDGGDSRTGRERL